MALVSLYDLRTAARNRCDMRTGGIFSDADFNSAINHSIAELYDLEIMAYGENYFLTGSVVPLQDGVTNYPLPSNHYKLMGIDWQAAPGAPWQTLKSFEFRERNRIANAPAIYTQCSTNAHYCLQGQSICVLPAPQAGQQIQIWYVPQAPKLVADTDSAEFQNGWETYVIVNAGIMALVAEESDASALMAQKAELKARIEDMTVNRNVTEPHQMIDVERRGHWDWW